MLWVVKIETSSPDDWIQMRETLAESTCLLGGDITTAMVDVDGWILHFEIEASDPTEAFSFATLRMFVAAELAHLPRWPIIAVQVIDAEYSSALCGD
jgi:hypothetical protein